MSRIGKRPVELPSGVSAAISGQTIEVKGPKGSRSFTATDDVTLAVEDNAVTVKPRGTSKRARQQWGMSRTMVANLVQGVTRAGQARAFSALWPTIATACVDAEVDVIADLGRLDRASAVMPLAEHSTHLLTVAAATLESVMHLREDVQDLMGALAQVAAIPVYPVLVGPDARAGRDRADLDQVLDDAGMAVRPTASVPFDPKALARLEQGESPSGRLGRTLLLRGAKALAASLGMVEVVPA